jgi:hypothetical protein
MRNPTAKVHDVKKLVRPHWPDYDEQQQTENAHSIEDDGACSWIPACTPIYS